MGSANASPELRRFFGNSTGAGRNNFFRTGQNEHCIISAVEGIEQGDAAGPALFACGLKSPLDLRRLAAAHQDDIRGYASDNERLEKVPTSQIHATRIFMPRQSLPI